MSEKLPMLRLVGNGLRGDDDWHPCGESLQRRTVSQRRTWGAFELHLYGPVWDKKWATPFFRELRKGVRCAFALSCELATRDKRTTLLDCRKNILHLCIDFPSGETSS